MGTLIGIILCIFGVRLCWESTLILDARKKAYKAGTHDYYGNPISKEDL